MTSLTRYQWWYGRDEPPIEPIPLRAGPVTANLVGRDLRNLRFGGIELAQRIYIAVRDRNWGTVPGEMTDLEVDQGPDRFAVRFSVNHRQHDVDFSWQGEILGSPDGTISYAMDATAGAEMTFKLIGLNLHHGMTEYRGRPYHGQTPDGPISGTFPTDVEPQLVADETEVPIFPAVSSLTAQLAEDVSVRFDFEGDTFEFEDQRNWTDASFKSQSYPPRRGGFLTARPADKVWQKVTVTPIGTAPTVVANDDAIHITLGGPIGKLPTLGLGMASHGRALSAGEADLLRALRLDHLRTDLRLSDPGFRDELRRAVSDAGELGCSLELAIHVTDDAEAQLTQLAGNLPRDARIARVLVFHENEPATDATWVGLARRYLGALAPDALFAGGTNANFCELNRFRPDGGPEDGIVYAITPQIHAFDELSLAENLAAQPETVRTARTFGNGRPVVVSPITLKPRFNSVATSDEPALAPGELPAQVDPRQLSLFAAAWTLGSIARLAESGVAALTYYETTGWRGVIQGDQPSPVPERFPAQPGMVFPLYHVLADLAEWKDGQVLSSSSSDPLAITSLALATAGRRHLLVANLTPNEQTVTVDTFPAGPITLAPFEFTRLDA